VNRRHQDIDEAEAMHGEQRLHRPYRIVKHVLVIDLIELVTQQGLQNVGILHDKDAVVRKNVRDASDDAMGVLVMGAAVPRDDDPGPAVARRQILRRPPAEEGAFRLDPLLPRNRTHVLRWVDAEHPPHSGLQMAQEQPDVAAELQDEGTLVGVAFAKHVIGQPGVMGAETRGIGREVQVVPIEVRFVQAVAELQVEAPAAFLEHQRVTALALVSRRLEDVGGRHRAEVEHQVDGIAADSTDHVISLEVEAPRAGARGLRPAPGLLAAPIDRARGAATRSFGSRFQT
jgi:hypothetical protein